MIELPSFSSAALALVACGGLWLCIWLGRWRWWGLVPIAVGMASLVVTRAPDLLVSGDMRVIAVRAPDGSYLPSTGRADVAVTDAWTKRAATRLGPVWPADGIAGDGVLQCDAQGCFYRVARHAVALIRDGSALVEDCRAAELVVSQVAARGSCVGAMLIDRIDTYQRGSYAVWLRPGKIDIETVRDWQGDRLWSPPARRGEVPRLRAALPDIEKE